MSDHSFKQWFQTPQGKRCLAIVGASLMLCMTVLILLLLPPNVPPATEETTPLSQTGASLPDGTVGQTEAIPVPTHDEIRGAYIASVFNINFPSRKDLSASQMQAELDQIVADAAATGLNTLYFQVRPTGDALYESELFPSSRYLVGTEGAPLPIDPLAYLVEQARKSDIDVVAWVNPYRITASNFSSKQAALDSLADTNPAVLHPEWTIFYGGKLYYDPGVPEVRELIADGIEEICEYGVVGVLYDDYFYPYPVQGEDFRDDASFAAYGAGKARDDWRRENVNLMVKKSYETIKAIRSDLTFGISPFGIWRNESSDPRGSETRGMEAYSSLYCDALSWIEGEYIDYISPQIYWERGYEIADFATLCRWWSAQVDGTSVKLIISHAAYRVGEFRLGGEEIAQQIQYARNYMNSAGNIQYGFQFIQDDTAGVRRALKELYSDSYEEEVYVPNVQGVSFMRPRNGLNSTRTAEFVTAASDPNYPVYLGEKKIGRTKSGFFSYHFKLSVGKNVVTFSQNGVDYSLSVTKKNASSSSSNTMSSFAVESISPAGGQTVILSSGASISLQAVCPGGCDVKAYLGELVIPMTPSKSASGLERVTYQATLTAPSISSGDDYHPLGELRILCTRGSQSAEKTGPSVSVIPESLPVSGVVNTDYTYLKISPSSSFYDDYTPAAKNMCENLTAFYDGCWRFAFGGFVEKKYVTVQKGTAASASVLTDIHASADEREVTFALSTGAKGAIHHTVDGKRIEVILYGTSKSSSLTPTLPEGNYLFESVLLETRGEDLVLVLTLKSQDNYYGFSHQYTTTGVSLSFRQPQSLAEGDRPLQGKTIVLDAGHGGNDSGALGFVSGYHEKDLNLKITLALAERLTDLGAEVILTRDGDKTVSLDERMALLNRTLPDLSVSIHHNSVNEATDANTARGTLGLYWSKAGISLANFVQQDLADRLNLYDVGIRQQKLALCRNHRFPQTLVETAFICAPAEFQWATRTDYADVCAEGICQGILNWYTMQESFLSGGN